VGHSHTAFVVESFIDELAHAAGKDPVAFRRELLPPGARARRVLDGAAEAFGWGRPLPAGHAAGIAVHESFGSAVAQVAEVSVEQGRIRVHRVVCAIDCGHVVNPLTVEMQVESAVVFALTAAIYGEITIRDGRVEQSNFHDYGMLRMREMPKVETIVMPSGGFWSGVGEPPVAVVAPALCNAIFAAAGKRIRSLPLKNHKLMKA
jgi:isoquinoline 1-oxidoreductase beta subunit